MKALYLRTVFWFGAKPGGSVGHTAGVINGMDRMVDLDVVSNDRLEGVERTIEVIEPGPLKYLPPRFGELPYSEIVFRKLREKVHSYDFMYHRYSGFSYGACKLSAHCAIPLVLEFNSSDVWKIRNWSKPSSRLLSPPAALYNRLRLPIVERVERANLRQAGLIVVVSNALKTELVERGVEPARILVNPNGVDPRLYSPAVEGKCVREKYGLGNNNVFGFIGTFAPFHGVVELAEAINRYFIENPERRADTRFLLIGDGKLLAQSRGVIADGGFKHNVVFTGAIPQHEGPAHLAACDVLLAPNVRNPDGTQYFQSPIKLFEYMAMGKPIIASRLGQIGEILTDSETAVLVPPGDVNALASAMQDLISRPEASVRMGEAARRKVLEGFTWQRHVERILSKVNELGFCTGEAPTRR
jgi:glycosyltransferase involved in cell wall biosynthesis